MAIDPTKLIPPTALNWGAQPQPVQPAPAAPSLDRSTLEAMAAGPQLDPLVPPAPVGATDTRKASVESASGARQERLAGASERRRALLCGHVFKPLHERGRYSGFPQFGDSTGKYVAARISAPQGPVNSRAVQLGQIDLCDQTADKNLLGLCVQLF